MLDLNNVLVVLDPDQEDQPSLDKVLTLARLADFNITLMTCEYTQYLVEGYYFDAAELPKLREELLTERKQELESLATKLRDEGLSVDTMAVWGHPAYETVIHTAVDISADLIIVHTRQHSALSRMLLTHNDWQLVRCCPIPLLLVKEKPWAKDPVVLAAVDPKHARHKPSGLDHRLLEMGSDLATLTGGTLWAVHSFTSTPLPDDRLAQVKKDHQEAFDRLMADFDVPADQQVLTEESPEFALSTVEADIGADVVVMGAISRSLLADVFIGNTTEKVLDFLSADVLIVKPADFQSPVFSNGASSQ